MRMLLPLLLASLVGPGAPNAGAQETPAKLRVCLLSGSEEYRSDETLEAFRKDLEARLPVECVLLKARGTDELPGLEAIGGCDVAVFFTRRLKIGGEDLDRIKTYCESGKGIVGIRTASHGFQNWLEFDRLVLGGNYKGHLSNNKEMRAVPAEGAESHPVMAGVGPIESRGSLYRTSPLSPDATPLMVGSTAEGTYPVTWVRNHRGARVFYTSLGAPGDFEDPSFRRLLTNAIVWAAGAKAPAPETGGAGTRKASRP